MALNRLILVPCLVGLMLAQNGSNIILHSKPLCCSNTFICSVLRPYGRSRSLPEVPQDSLFWHGCCLSLCFFGGKGKKRLKPFLARTLVGPQKPCFVAFWDMTAFPWSWTSMYPLTTSRAILFIPRCGLCVVHSWPLTEGQIGWKPYFWCVFRHFWVGMKLAQIGSKPCWFAQVFFSLFGSHHLGQNIAPNCSLWSVFWTLECPQTHISKGCSAPPKLPLLCMFWGQQTVPFCHVQGPIWWVRCFPMMWRLVLVGGMWCISTKNPFWWNLGPTLRRSPGVIKVRAVRCRLWAFRWCSGTVWVSWRHT